MSTVIQAPGHARWWRRLASAAVLFFALKGLFWLALTAWFVS